MIAFINNEDILVIPNNVHLSHVVSDENMSQ